MKYKNNIIIFIIIAILVGAVILAIVNSSRTPTSQTVTDVATSTALSTSTPAGFDKTISDGTIRIAYSSADFGLATSAEEVLVKSYIPSCEEGFAYCLYFNGSRYVGTNFEAAGLAVKKRTDLTSETACITTPPDGYDPRIAPDQKGSTDKYSWSEFSKIGDAGAGHYASGSLYRLYVTSATPKCYELMTRIGQTQFANYPAGAIKEFTAVDQSDVEASLKQIIDNISLVSGEKGLF